MNIKKITLITGAVFYLAMLVLSFTAKKMHIASLPKVTVENLKTERFEDKIVDTEESEIENKEETVTTEKSVNIMESNQYRWNVAIPKELYDNQKVYIIIKEILNGEERSIAKEVTNLVIGQSNDSNYEVISGLSSYDQVVRTGQKLIQDGCEVYVED